MALEYEYVRNAFHQAMERSIETFFRTIATLFALHQEQMKEASSPREVVDDPSPSTQSPESPSFDFKLEEALQPSDIERKKAQHVLEKMGWKLSNT